MIISYDEITKNKQWWSQLSEDEREEYVQKVFRYYRINGFPFYVYPPEKIQNELEKLYKFDKELISNCEVKQTMHGLGLCWSYFPHAFEVRNLTAKSPIDIFIDNELFLTAIRKRVKFGDNISDAGIRKAIRKYGGVGVSNFRPTAAYAIYKKYGGDGVIWDMSGGYGGRLLGAFMSKKINHYIATEPDKRTTQGLEKMGIDILSHATIPLKYIQIFPQGSEDFKPWRENFIDLCFTSPPYFNTERYSDEPTQSYIKFPKYNDWLEGFWEKTLKNCMYGLKSGGHLVFNVANVKTAPSLTTDCCDIAKKVGFQLVDTLQLQLSGRPHKIIEKAFKYEPIYVFTKRIK
ncbi:MAG: site-specific DNA-methyltransferase [Gammaproteobacteria bacterium]|nr:site-specific DNA-methyltransferase [Gammaproteobacteria bacterium]